jgi:hypothetical protein
VADRDVHVQTIEGFRSLLKSGIRGVPPGSTKWLQSYPRLVRMALHPSRVHPAQARHSLGLANGRLRHGLEGWQTPLPVFERRARPNTLRPQLTARGSMSDHFSSSNPGVGGITRHSGGLSLFGAGGIRGEHRLPMPEPYKEVQFTWGTDARGTRAAALAILASALNEESSQAIDQTRSWELHERFAVEVLARLDPAAPLLLDWLTVQEWADQILNGEPGELVRCIHRVREMERLLRVALDREATTRTRIVDPNLWAVWDIESCLNTCIARERYPMDRLPRFADHLLDIKFKLYCLLEVDMPLYGREIERTGVEVNRPNDTPQGFLTRLSADVTLTVKSRAIWESVMNAVYEAENDKALGSTKVVDESGVPFRSRTTRFFPWAREHPRWFALASFEPLVSELEEWRTPELHSLSRARAAFTRGEMKDIKPLLRLLNAVLHFVWDHLVTVVALDRAPEYDVTTQDGMRIDLR